MHRLINAAVKTDNLDMIEYLSKRTPTFSLRRFGCCTASDLWAFLQKVNRTELFARFLPDHPEGYSSIAWKEHS